MRIYISLYSLYLKIIGAASFTLTRHRLKVVPVIVYFATRGGLND